MRVGLEKEQEKDAAEMFSLAECNHFLTVRKNLNTICAARMSKMGSDVMLASFGNITKLEHAKYLVG